MNSTRKTAITVGVLFIVASVAPLLSMPFTQYVDTPDYLVNVSANATRVIAGSIFEIIMAIAIAGIAIMIYPILKKHNEGLALGYVGFRIAEGLLFVVSVINMLAVVSLSREFATAGAMDAAYYQGFGTILLAVRDWSGHVLGSIAFSLGALILYSLLYKSKLVPRWLAIWGLIGAPLALAEGLLIMFGNIDPFSTNTILLNIPIAVNEMVLAVWLIVKGFNSSAIDSYTTRVSTK